MADETARRGEAAILHCRREGTPGKPVLVLVHGFGGSGHHFDGIAAALAGSADIYLLDLPGHGRSRDVPGSRHAKAASEALLATMTAQGVERFHLAGFSLGGAVACLAALKSPERVISLTLLAPGGFGPEIAAETLRSFATAVTEEECRKGLAAMMAPDATVSPDELAAVTAERAGGALEPELSAVAAMITRDGKQGSIPRSELAKIACPVRVVWGTADPVLPFSQSDGLPNGWELRRFEGAGHMLAAEASAAVIAALEAAVSS